MKVLSLRIGEMPWWIALCNLISRENRFKGIKDCYKKV